MQAAAQQRGGKPLQRGLFELVQIHKADAQAYAVVGEVFFQIPFFIRKRHKGEVQAAALAQQTDNVRQDAAGQTRGGVAPGQGLAVGVVAHTQQGRGGNKVLFASAQGGLVTADQVAAGQAVFQVGLFQLYLGHGMVHFSHEGLVLRRGDVVERRGVVFGQQLFVIAQVEDNAQDGVHRAGAHGLASVLHVFKDLQRGGAEVIAPGKGGKVLAPEGSARRTDAQPGKSRKILIGKCGIFAQGDQGRKGGAAGVEAEQVAFFPFGRMQRGPQQVNAVLVQGFLSFCPVVQHHGGEGPARVLGHLLQIGKVVPGNNVVFYAVEAGHREHPHPDHAGFLSHGGNRRRQNRQEGEEQEAEVPEHRRPSWW